MGVGLRYVNHVKGLQSHRCTCQSRHCPLYWRAVRRHPTPKLEDCSCPLHLDSACSILMVNTEMDLWKIKGHWY